MIKFSLFKLLASNNWSSTDTTPQWKPSCDYFSITDTLVSQIDIGW